MGISILKSLDPAFQKYSIQEVWGSSGARLPALDFGGGATGAGGITFSTSLLLGLSRHFVVSCICVFGMSVFVYETLQF